MKLDNISLNKIKDEVIANILNDLTTSEELTSEEVEFKRQELEQLIKSKKLITQQRVQGGVTNAKDFNDTIEELYIDILTTFGYVNSLDESINKHVEINQATINNIKALINKADDRLDAYEAILSSKGNPSHHIEGFRNADSFEEKDELYTERYGEKIPLSTRVYFDSNEELIHLNYLRNQNMMTFKNGVSLGDISVKKQLGNGFIKIRNDANKPDNAIDTSYQTYWSETILCDAPLRVSFDIIKPTDPLALQDFYYGVQHGAMCELELNFEAVSIVNEISLMPYGQYPLEIIAIRYKSSDDTEEPVKEIIYPDNPNPTLRGKTIVGPTSFRFADTVCKKIYVLFNQIHYTKNTYIYSPNEIFKNELWFSVTNSSNLKPDIKDDLLFAPNYLDKALNDNAWTYINNMAVKDKYIDLKKILFDDEKVRKAVTKYQYTYGFYNIAPNFNDFERTGVYVSKMIPASGNIKSVRITTDEEHPIDDKSVRWSDIEYYISYKDKPEWEDWIPILPTNVDHIQCELLQTQGSLCYLRFPAEELDGVFINGSPMIREVDYFVHVNNDGYIYAVDIPNFDYYAKYTASYKPHPDSSIINLNGEDGDTVVSSLEVINGADESYYELTNFPYISLANKVPTDIKIINKDTGVVQSQGNGDIVCVTDPYNPNESYKYFDKSTSKIQYYTDKNYLYFNQNIDSNKLIEINYDHCVSQIRLKAILRRNTLKNGWITPTLTKIKYEFVTMD